MKSKKLIAATKDFLEAIKKQDRQVTFQDVLEFNRIYNPELYREYVEAKSHFEKNYPEFLSQEQLDKLKK